MAPGWEGLLAPREMPRDVLPEGEVGVHSGDSR